jgi:phage baseplate assembly protein V
VTDRLLAPLIRRVNMMLGRGVLRAVDDSRGIQTVQASLLQDELGDGIERPQGYGLSSNPPVGAAIIAGFLFGNRDQGIVLAECASDVRPKGLKPGEVVLYNDKSVSLTLDAAGDLTIRARNVKFIVSGQITMDQG